MLKESGLKVLPMVRGTFCREYLKRIADSGRSWRKQCLIKMHHIEQRRILVKDSAEISKQFCKAAQYILAQLVVSKQ